MSKKRTRGEGNLKKVKSGSWNGQLMDGYENGKRKIVSFTAPTKTEVLQMIREYHEKKKQKDESPPKPTFSEWADRWYVDYRTQVAASTYSGYLFTLKLLKAAFGNKLISDILPMEINSYFNSLLDQGCSHSKINKCRSMLIQIFDAAEQNNFVTRNPARAAKIIRIDLFRNEIEVSKKDSFSETEIDILFRELPNNFIGNSIRLLLITGMRIQELLALCAKDITSDGSIIHINKAVKMVDGKPKLGPPKSKKSRRDIPIPVDYRHLAVYLREHGGKLFLWQSHHIGEPCCIEHFRYHFTKAIKDIPVRKLTPHCCRHTYVTRLQARGVPMETIARLAGHSSISTTDVYLHTSIETLAQAVNTLGTGGNNHDE